jgi:hypothetical protein
VAPPPRPPLRSADPPHKGEGFRTVTIKSQRCKKCVSIFPYAIALSAGGARERAAFAERPSTNSENSSLRLQNWPAARLNQGIGVPNQFGSRTKLGNNGAIDLGGTRLAGWGTVNAG